MAARPQGQATQPITIRINGEWRAFEVGRDLEPSTTLSAFLREHLGFTGLKISCDEGACGACTIIMDGVAVLSCMLLAVEADGHDLLTIEGLPYDDPVIEAFAEQCEPGHGTALQCGYCTPGFVMTTRALLEREPHALPGRGEGSALRQPLPLRLLRGDRDGGGARGREDRGEGRTAIRWIAIGRGGRA